MRKLSYHEPLVVYDGLQVFMASDQFGQRHVCTLVEQTESTDTYLCAPVSLDRANALINGKVELRELYVSPEVPELTSIMSIGGVLEDLNTTPVPIESVSESWLPKTGFFLVPAPHHEETVVNEAVDRSRAVVHCRLNPPEAAGETTITVEHLSQSTKLLQRLVKHAFRRAVRNCKKEVRAKLVDSEHHELRVFAFSPGSFTVHMQSAVPADLVGYAELERALTLIDRVTSHSQVPDETVKEVSELGGHFATAYKDLLKFLSETRTHFSYQWATPSVTNSPPHAITSSQAGPLYDALMQRTDIETEIVNLVGTLTKVDEKLGTWRITNEADGREYSGSSEADLAGLVIGTVRYAFRCEEKLEEERGTGKEFLKLVLTDFKPVSGKP